MKNKPDIILIGGGGHCKAVIDVIEAENTFHIAGILDVPKKIGESVLGYPIIGSDDDIGHFIKKYKAVFITVGQIKSPDLRIKLFEKAKNAGGNFPVIISPEAYVSKHSEIQEGTIIMHGAVINADSKIGKNTIINNLALIEHDVIIGNHCHISTNSSVNGGTKLGNNCLAGSNSVLKQNISITSNTIIGAGAVVTKDIIDGGVYVGNPARKIK